ncbi:hypothetical protein MELA_02192 [Candidatus Methylomirabilis lanthanidiphila]|uniref:Ribbon-helix-helix protein CopG domain-containing protein n=1 Tax=Candidatus Methylomirabilis lanthanidiphila TaxID=2211376 RepID=A0A564ZLR9_9BACT|nr:ribbon-helix-helix domain-containing protein [Candidatus Methylomirabilis lanthanidiphila]VUZ85807.1 hypothetical protein MELA_02192 [Candidatus Methylomirabilis lanthanidiphila]
MRPKAAPPAGRRSGQTQKQRTRSTEAKVVRDLSEETERPLDAEDIALASLDAQVRAKEARSDLGATGGPDGVVAIHLSGAVIARLEAEARRRGIAESELIKRALVQYLRI